MSVIYSWTECKHSFLALPLHCELNFTVKHHHKCVSSQWILKPKRRSQRNMSSLHCYPYIWLRTCPRHHRRPDPCTLAVCLLVASGEHKAAFLLHSYARRQRFLHGAGLLLGTPTSNEAISTPVHIGGSVIFSRYIYSKLVHKYVYATCEFQL